MNEPATEKPYKITWSYIIPTSERLHTDRRTFYSYVRIYLLCVISTLNFIILHSREIGASNQQDKKISDSEKTDYYEMLRFIVLF